MWGEWCSGCTMGIAEADCRNGDRQCCEREARSEEGLNAWTPLRKAESRQKKMVQWQLRVKTGLGGAMGGKLFKCRLERVKLEALRIPRFEAAGGATGAV